MKIRQRDFDLCQIAESGQCFRMNPLNEDGTAYGITAMGRRLEILQEGEEFTLSCGEEEFEAVWREYFDFDTDYGAMKAKVDPTDQFMQESMAAGGGIRILRQDLWEVMVSFVISQNNNIVRIKRSIEALCERYGERIETPESCALTEEQGLLTFSFPSPHVLAALKPQDLQGCGLGYRDRYVICAAQAVKEGALDLEALKRMEYGQAREALMGICGIGIKVAECICLFGLHHIEAFPIDTHVNRLLQDHYPDGFPFERYQGFAGVLQQYGFYTQLHKAKKKGRK